MSEEQDKQDLVFTRTCPRCRRTGRVYARDGVRDDVMAVGEFLGDGWTEQRDDNGDKVLVCPICSPSGAGSRGGAGMSSSMNPSLPNLDDIGIFTRRCEQHGCFASERVYATCAAEASVEFYQRGWRKVDGKWRCPACEKREDAT